MSIPAWILDIFAAVMLLVAAVSAGQLAVARAWTRAGARDADIAVSHLLMGIAMAGMLVASLSTLPNVAWEAVFAAMTAWFAWCLWRESRGHGAGALVRGHHAPHLVHSAAMLYMFAALAGPSSGGGSGMSGMAGGSSGATQTLHAPTLAFVFVLLLIGYTVRDLDRQACADGYFHVVGRHFAPAPALATSGPALAGRGGWRRRGRDHAAGRPGGSGRPGARRGRARRGTAAARARRGQGLPGSDGRHHGLHAHHHDLSRPNRRPPVRAARRRT